MTAKLVQLTVNGREEHIAADGLTSLQQVLREKLDYNTVKDGCTQGGCGACFIRALREAEGAPTESGAGDLT